MCYEIDAKRMSCLCSLVFLIAQAEERQTPSSSAFHMSIVKVRAHTTATRMSPVDGGLLRRIVAGFPANSAIHSGDNSSSALRLFAVAPVVSHTQIRLSSVLWLSFSGSPKVVGDSFSGCPRFHCGNRRILRSSFASAF